LIISTPTAPVAPTTAICGLRFIQRAGHYTGRKGTVKPRTLRFWARLAFFRPLRLVLVETSARSRSSDRYIPSAPLRPSRLTWRSPKARLFTGCGGGLRSPLSGLFRNLERRSESATVFDRAARLRGPFRTS
jgi:hypothetical protein